MKYFYLAFLITILFPLFSSAQNINADSTQKQSVINDPVKFFVGVSLNSFSGDVSSSTDALNNAKTSKSTMPGFDLGVDIPLDQSNIWIFRAESGITSNNNSFNAQDITGSVTQMSEAISFKQTIINITPQIIFNVIKTGALDVYLSTGMVIDIRSYKDKSYTSTTTYSTSGTTNTSSLPEPDYKSATFCVPAKVGVVIAKHINLFAAYNAKTSLNDDSTFAINETSFVVGLNYIFGSK